tara:strand:+ start:315 stop:458 length:144 start_codon:yes stop_codon:yes gene_type:complete
MSYNELQEYMSQLDLLVDTKKSLPRKISAAREEEMSQMTPKATFVEG